MEGLIVTDVFNWLTGHFPDVAALVFLIIVVAWTAIKINNFGHRFTATEQLCNNIQTQQLPEIRAEIKEVRREMNERFSKIDERLFKIELSLNTIATYLSTKSGKFNIGDNKIE